MPRFSVALTLAAGVAGDARGANKRNKAFLSLASDMQPEVVARTLSEVEDEWKSQAASFAECNTTETSECGGAPEAFSKSCSTVVSAVVQASSGDRSSVKEYMNTVCGENELSGWHAERCTELASAVTDSMLDDNYENRENFNSGSLCTSFWSKFVVEEKARVEKDRSEREAAEKKAAEPKPDEPAGKLGRWLKRAENKESDKSAKPASDKTMPEIEEGAADTPKSSDAVDVAEHCCERVRRAWVTAEKAGGGSAFLREKAKLAEEKRALENLMQMVYAVRNTPEQTDDNGHMPMRGAGFGLAMNGSPPALPPHLAPPGMGGGMQGMQGMMPPGGPPGDRKSVV